MIAIGVAVVIGGTGSAISALVAAVQGQDDGAYTQCVDESLASVPLSTDTDDYAKLAVAAARECASK